MIRLLLTTPVALLVACSGEVQPPGTELGSSEAALYVDQGGQLQGGQLQGGQLQGGQLQGGQLQGGQLQGGQLQSDPLQTDIVSDDVREEPIAHAYAGMTLGGNALDKVRIERGELVAERLSGSSLNSHRVTLRGDQLVGAQLQAVTGGGATLRHRITEVLPQGSGAFLYRLEEQQADGTWRAWCHPDVNGVAAALPVAAVIDSSASRVASSTHFSFGCTSGAIAKCSRWGYTPWGTPELHWACTRLARADYCGNGTPYTRDGTLINIWDTLPTPIQEHGEPMPGMLFEAGWTSRGAACLSKQRWLTLSPDVVAACSDRLIAPGAAVGTVTVCEDPAQAQAFGNVQLFNESQLNMH